MPLSSPPPPDVSFSSTLVAYVNMRPFIQLVPLVGLLLSTLVAVEGSPIHYVTKTITVERPADFTHSSTSAVVPPPAEVTPSTTTTVILSSSSSSSQQQQQPQVDPQSSSSTTDPATTSLEPANIPLSSATLIPPPANIPQIADNRSIIVTNLCDGDIWPAVLTTQSTGPYTQGFYLPSGAQIELWTADDWIGRIWARTGCSFDASGTGSCATGSCGNTLDCSISGQSPTTLAEFNLDGYASQAFWDISLVNGFNIPLAIIASPTTTNAICGWQNTPAAITQYCPEELIYYANSSGIYEEIVGCMSACDEFGSPQYCCTGSYDSSGACTPSTYSEAFKSVCPDAYSYAFDDATSTYATPSVPGSSFEIVFCPAT